MTLPVSSYEELLARVRSLTSETIQLRQEISSSLCGEPGSGGTPLPNQNEYEHCLKSHHINQLRERISAREDLSPNGAADVRTVGTALVRPTSLSDKKVDEVDNELKDIDEKLTSPISPMEKNSFHRGGWAPDALGLWHSGPSSLNLNQSSHLNAPYQDLSSSVTCISHGPQSFSGFSSSAKRTYSHQQLGAKVEMVYSLLSMLDTDNREDMSKTFLAMSSSPESCHAMRQSGCLPLLIQLIYSPELERQVRNRAAEALQNVVYAQSDEKRRKREVRVLKLLQQVREYCDELKDFSARTQPQESEADKHPINATGTLMKLSFDAEHRQAICVLGGLHAITDLIQVDHEVHGSTSSDNFCITLRRYAGMSLTNLTFGDGKNKALLCSFSKFLLALVDQLKSPSEDLRQVTASVLRNLSWRADLESKQALRNVSAVTALTVSAMEAKKESTLKSILSALWNLSAHCSLNKIDICAVPGALAFLVKMLKYKSASNTLSIIENAGGILRNVSSHIAVREDYRQILRDNYCFEVLLEQLKSPSLTVVSNACGTLWNLSARCPEDQKRLWDMGATSMLRSLVQSKHKMISMGSSAALKNLLAANPNENLLTHLDSTAKSLGLQNLPTLFVRKKKALEQELNITLAETCDNIEPVPSSFQAEGSEDKKEKKNCDSPKRSDSHDSVRSSQSDTVYELLNQRAHASEEKILESNAATLHGSLDEKMMNRRTEDQKLMKRYTASMIPTPTSKKMSQDRINEKTREDQPVADDADGSSAKGDAKEQTNPDSKQKLKKGIPVLKTKPKKAGLQDGVSQERGSSTKSQTFECCETKSLSRENTDVEYPASGKNNKASDLGRHPAQESDAFSQSDGTGTRNEYEENWREETKTEFAFSGRDGVEPPRESACVEYGKTYRKKNVDHTRKNFNVNSNKAEQTEHHDSCGNELERFEEGVSRDSNSVANESLPPDHLPMAHTELNSEKPFALEGNSKEPSSGKRREVRSHSQRQNSELDDDQRGLIEEVHHEFKPFEQNPGFRTCVASQKKPVESPKPSISLRAFDGTRTEGNNANASEDGSDILPEAFSVLNVAHKMGGSLECSEAEGPSPFRGDPTGKASNSSTDEVGMKASSQCVLPKFKVGSPMTDTRALQMEARKICREIQKEHDFEMGGSLISEVSLVSCSSFLDTGDYSLFDCSTDTVNFDESDVLRAVPFNKNHSFTKSVSQAAESGCSLPSLGSLKNEQIEALDLDNSVLSVASITSEIDENYTRDPTYVSCCTKTYEVDARNEFPEEISADATVVSREDDTLNPELFDDDNSLHSQENLPFDVDTFQDEMPVERTRPKLTPKEKRKTFQERYRTYTIRDFRPLNAPGKGTTVDHNDKSCDDLTITAEAPNCYGQSGRDGEQQSFIKTTFNRYNVAWDPDFKKENVDERAQSHDMVFDALHGPRGHEPIQFSKSFDKEREAVPGFVYDSRSLNDLLSVGPSERKELVDNAKLVAFSLKTAIQDWDTDFVSDSEADEPHKTSEIDTATYTKAFRYRAHSRLSLQELQSEENFKDPCTENVEKVGAKICKPKDVGEEETEELSKGIRGRRKPLYSSPQKIPPKSKIPPSSASNAKPAPAIADAKKPSPQQQATTCQSPVLNREGTFTKENGSALKRPEGKVVGVIPVLSRTSEPKNPTRLSGKSKVATSSANAKTVGESKISRIGRPLSTYASKPSDRRTESDSSQRRPYSTGGGNRTSGESSVTAKKPASSSLVPQKMKNSSSSQNVKAGSSPTHNPSPKYRGLNSQSGKSQSDASLHLMDSKDKAGKSKTSKKEVTSKIASLWRKVEETKEKNKNLKDTRVWIEPEKNTGSSETLVLEKEEILHIPTRTIVHSFTCHALTDETPNDFPHHKRNSQNSQEVPCGGNADERRDKMQKRSIISAVVTPYNYNPPSAVANPPGFKEVDGFQKNSLKVTTV